MNPQLWNYSKDPNNNRNMHYKDESDDNPMSHKNQTNYSLNNMNMSSLMNNPSGKQNNVNMQNMNMNMQNMSMGNSQ